MVDEVKVSLIVGDEEVRVVDVPYCAETATAIFEEIKTYLKLKGWGLMESTLMEYENGKRVLVIVDGE